MVEPVVWYYQPDILNHVSEKVFKMYGQLFSGVWVASAFKGASGSAQFMTNTSLHITNHLQWLDIIHSLGVKQKVVNFRGIAMTGWQRYDHFAVLCELFPVGLPSLAICLQIFQSGSFGQGELANSSKILKCSSNLSPGFPEINWDGTVKVQNCSFPGSNVFYWVQQFWGALEVYERDLYIQSIVAGWVTDHQLRLGVSNPGHLLYLIDNLNKVCISIYSSAVFLSHTLILYFKLFSVSRRQI